MNTDTAFENAETLSRTLDPSTSGIAADRLTQSGKRDSWKTKILTWLRERDIFTDLTALTPSELALESGFPHPSCHKRLPDLARDGWVTKVGQRKCRVTGEQAWTWRACTLTDLRQRDFLPATA